MQNPQKKIKKKSFLFLKHKKKEKRHSDEEQ